MESAGLRREVDQLRQPSIFAAKELTVLPGRTVTIRDAGPYGLIMLQGHGTLGVWPIETPALIRFGQLTHDEYFVSCAAAQAGVHDHQPQRARPDRDAEALWPQPRGAAGIVVLLMRTIYFEKNIPKVLLCMALRPIWPGVVYSPLSPTRMVDLPDPALPGPRWVRVRNHMCGICASDLHLLFVETDPQVAPAALPGIERRYLGHELVGEVTEVGPGSARCAWETG